MEKRPKRKRFKRGCLIWFLLLIALLVWNIQTSHRHPWSDERIMALFNENRVEFEEVRDLIARERIVLLTSDQLDYENLMLNEVGNSIDTVRRLVSFGIDEILISDTCVNFGFEEILEPWPFIQIKSIIYCEDPSLLLPEANIFSNIYILSPHQDTDEYFRDPYCLRGGTKVLRPLEGNWYIRHWLINTKRDNDC